MQKQRLKILFTLFAVFSTGIFCSAQSNSQQLKRADSLFAKKQYTQSLEEYKQIFEKGAYSPAMLLRMSRIEEGLGHTARSLYYLNLNYLATKDPQVLEKMGEVAGRNNLQGYEPSQIEETLAWISTYQVEITLALLSLVVLFFSLVLHTNRKKESPSVSFFFLSVSVVALLLVNHYDLIKEKGIVTQEPIYLMTGPSAGADVLAIVGPGHRVVVEGQQDVWMKVRWGEKSAFIKKSQLLPIGL